MSTIRTASTVLLSPVACDEESWQFVSMPSANHFLYPGHGKRERAPGWTLEQMADEVVDRYQGPIDIIAIAIGGSIAQYILTRHPERVRSAFIACSRPAVGHRDPGRWRTEMNARATAALDLGMAGVVEASLKRWFTKQAIEANLPGVLYARRALLAMDPLAWADVWRARQRSAFIAPELFAAMRQRVSVVAAADDASVSRSEVEALSRLIPGSRLEVLPGPHMIHLEQPGPLADAIRRHLSWVRPN